MKQTRIQDRNVLCRLVEEGSWLPFACLVRQLVEAGCHVSVSIRPAAEEYVGVVAFGELGARSVQVAKDLVPEALSGIECLVFYGGDTPPPPIFCPLVHVTEAATETESVLTDEEYRRFTVSPSECGGEIEIAVAAAIGPTPLSGRHVLVTAGPTVEDIDPVRFISNRSSGKMGLALASAALSRGARVTLIHGPIGGSIPGIAGFEAVHVRSASSMYDCVMARIAECDVAVMCAAVADFTPAVVASRKIKKETSELPALPLARTRDILASIGRLADRPVLVGFAAETHDVAANAALKLVRKNCDLLCANDVSEKGSGFGTDTNRVTIHRRQRSPVVLPLLTKAQVADCILEELLTFLF